MTREDYPLTVHFSSLGIATVPSSPIRPREAGPSEAPQLVLASQSKRATKKSVGPLMDDKGNVVSTNNLKADCLLNYFQSVHREDNYANLQLDSRAFPTIPTAMPPISLTAQDIRKQVAAICRYKSSGPDGIHPAILKPLAGVLAVPLASLRKVPTRQMLTERLEDCHSHADPQGRC